MLDLISVTSVNNQSLRRSLNSHFENMRDVSLCRGQFRFPKDLNGYKHNFNCSSECKTSHVSLSNEDYLRFIKPIINSVEVALANLGLNRRQHTCWMWFFKYLVSHVGGLPYMDKLRQLSAIAAAFREYAITGSVIAKPIMSELCDRLGGGYVMSTRLGVFFQISCFKRALPLPDKEGVSASCKKHREVVTSVFTTDQKHLSSVQDFSYEWAKKMRKNLTGNMAFRPGSGASYDSTRKEGGGANSVEKIVSNWLVEEMDYEEFEIVRNSSNLSVSGIILYDPVIGQYEGKRKRRELLRTNLTSREREEFGALLSESKREEFFMEVWRLQSCYDYVSKYLGSDILPRSKYVAIRENGGKVRSLAKSEASLVYLSNACGETIRDLLKKEISVKGALTGVPFESWMVTLRKWIKFLGTQSTFTEHLSDLGITAKDFVFRSADLTSATDLLPRDVVHHIVSGILMGLGVDMGDEPNSLFGEIMRWTTGQWILEYRNDSVVTTRGVSMGLPVSWPILNLYNLWLVNESWRLIGVNGFGLTRKNRCHTQCGDDLVAYWPKIVNDNYTRLLQETGGELSEGKDLTSKSCFNFVEKAGCLTFRRGSPTFHVPTIIPMKSVCGSNSGSSVPRFIEAGNSITTTMAMLPDGSNVRRIVGGIVKVSYADLIGKLDHLGLYPYIPRVYGGGGFPILARESDCWRCYPRFARAWRVLLSHLHGWRAVRASTGLTTAWSPVYTAHTRWDGIWNKVKAHYDEYNVGFKTHDSNVSEDSYVGDQVTAALSRLTYLSTGQLLKDQDWPSMSDVANRLKDAVQRLNAMVPSYKLKDLPNDMSKGIRRSKHRLEEEYSLHPSFVELTLAEELCRGTKPKVGAVDRRAIADRYAQFTSVSLDAEMELYLLDGCVTGLES